MICPPSLNSLSLEKITSLRGGASGSPVVFTLPDGKILFGNLKYGVTKWKGGGVGYEFPLFNQSNFQDNIKPFIIKGIALQTPETLTKFIDAIPDEGF